jgi:NAD(P)-dependent dehydrogenase (short-subunit alcohol dehydrogenase family)
MFIFLKETLQDSEPEKRRGMMARRSTGLQGNKELLDYMERPAQPKEIAPAFVFFASEADSSYITGEVLTLLGGETTAA